MPTLQRLETTQIPTLLSMRQKTNKTKNNSMKLHNIDNLKRMRTFDNLSKKLIRLKNIHKEIHTHINAIYPQEIETIEPWLNTSEQLIQECRTLLLELDDRFTT